MCDKMVDFPKFGHVYACTLGPCLYISGKVRVPVVYVYNVTYAG